MNACHARRAPRSLSLVLLGTLSACSGNAPVERASAESSAIVGGQTAGTYSEAALVDAFQSGNPYQYISCSGAVIAPRVVLTAGHCIVGNSSFNVAAPFAGGQTATSQSGVTYDYTMNGSGGVDPNHHDVGLVFLDTPITLTRYPELAGGPLPEGAQVVEIGRIQDGVVSDTALFVGHPVNVSLHGLPFDYATSAELTQHGDSGGPDEVPGSATHKIVAVNSGSGSGIDSLARVDLLYAWIQGQVAQHGGGGYVAPVGADAGAPSHDAGSGSNGGGPGSDAGSGGDGGPGSGSEAGPSSGSDAGSTLDAASGDGSTDAGAGGSPSGNAGEAGGGGAAGDDAGAIGSGGASAPSSGAPDGVTPPTDGEPTSAATTSGCAIGRGSRASGEVWAGLGALALLAAGFRRRGRTRA